MGTEVIRDQQVAPISTTARPAEVAVLFDAIVYFSEMAAGNQDERPSSHHRAAGDSSGAKPARSTHGRSLTRPWRLPAVNRSFEN